MEYRRLGQTALNVSVLGFGASPLGDVFERTDAREGEKAVHLAIDRGINFFDVSPYYGLTLAESRLGDALDGRRDEIVLATKCGRYGADEFDFSASRITAGLEDSLRRLKTGHVDLLQAHDVEFGDARQIVDETIPAMRRLQEQGKARYVGITGFSPTNLEKILRAIPIDTVLSYCRYNLMVTDLETALLPIARESGVGVVNASPLHMGILTEGGAPRWHPAPAEVQEAGRRVVALCRERGVSASQVALRFCMDCAGIASTLVGMSTPKQVEANTRCVGEVNDPELLCAIRRLIAPVFNTIWSSGLPENYG